MGTITIDRSSLKLSASLLIAGQLLYVLVTLLHTGGEANHHPEIFAAYAASAAWTAVHVAQFACMAIFLAGLLALGFALDSAGSNGERGATKISPWVLQCFCSRLRSRGRAALRARSPG